MGSRAITGHTRAGRSQWYVHAVQSQHMEEVTWSLVLCVCASDKTIFPQFFRDWQQYGQLMAAVEQTTPCYIYKRKT